ncbi:hypothetical protein GYMLUDRAFT_861796 [Collybiopsis luxurians FD-317 M1]|nr:hypothetical protein GYMLUDRAFT_861796 [Collybiopsis luxurians FD-317 M1]
MVEKKFRVGICGGGIGGLICAFALSRYNDIEVHVFESANSLSEVGAGIGVWPRAWKVLKELGLVDALLQVVQEQPSDNEVPAFKYRKSDQALGLDITTLYAKSGGLKPFYRPDFQNVLLEQLSGSNCSLHVRKRMRSYAASGSGSIEMLFEDGTAFTCDMLVGSDGLRSACRRTLLTREAQLFQERGDLSTASEILSSVAPVWSGIMAYRLVIPRDVLQKHYPDHPVLTSPTHYLGQDTHCIVYTMAQGRLVNFAAFHHHVQYDPVFTGPWTSTGSNSELRELFVGWEPSFQALVECAGNPLKWAIHSVKPLHSLVSSRDPVALIGDAAHGMEPFQGNGAGQAIEDAYVLATILGHPKTTKSNLVPMLSVYDKIRRPFSTEVACRSHLAGRYFALHSEHPDFDPCNLEHLQQHIKTIGEHWEYIWDTELKLDKGSLKLVS